MLQGFEQRQTMLAMYNQELNRDNVTPSYPRLMVRQQIHQTIGTRNFKAQNERIETGVLVKSHKEETSALTEKWENGFSGKQLDNVRRATHVVLITGPILVGEHNHPLLL